MVYCSWDGSFRHLKNIIVENVVFAGLHDFLSDPTRLVDAVETSSFGDEIIKSLGTQGVTSAKAKKPSNDQLRPLLGRIDLRKDKVTVHVDMAEVASLLFAKEKSKNSEPSQPLYALSLPVQLKRRGVEMKIIVPGKPKTDASRDESLIKLISKAHMWFEDLKSSSAVSLEEIALSEKMSASDVSRYLPLAFLAPDITESILKGAQPDGLSVQSFKRMPPLPLLWSDQRIQFGSAN